MHTRVESVTSPTATLAPGLFDDWCLSRLSKFLEGRASAAQLWNDERARLRPVPPVATVVIKDRATLVRLLASAVAAFGEAYSAGRIVVKGDLVRRSKPSIDALAGRTL